MGSSQITLQGFEKRVRRTAALRPMARSQDRQILLVSTMVDSPTASGMADELERLRDRVIALEHGVGAVAIRIDSEVHHVSEGFKDQQTFILKHVYGLEQKMEERFGRIEYRMDIRFTLLDDKIDRLESKLDKFITAQTEFNRLVEARLRRLERSSGTAPASNR